MNAMRFEDIPMLEGGSRWLGHFRVLGDERVALIRHVAGKQCDLLRVRVPGQRIVLANGPGVLYEVLVSKARCFEKSPVLRISLYPLAGDGLFTSEGELWRRQRKRMAPMFRQKALQDYAVAMATCAERAIESWQDGAVLDMWRETTRIAMSVAGKTLFDADTFSDAEELGAALTTALHWVNDQSSHPLLIAQARAQTALMIASHEVPDPFSSWLVRGAEALHKTILLPGKRTRQLRSALDVLERRVERMIADRRSAVTPPADLLTQLLDSRDEDDGSRMSDKQVRDEVLTLFIAGHETTSSGLAWSLYLLAKHPEAYRRAQEEADALTSEHVGFDDLPRLPYCLQVFKEALRMYAPIYLFGRQNIEPVEVGGYSFPVGTVVIISPFGLHHRADVWPEPDRFDPERFTPEAEQARPREAYLPFSGGPRTCIGNHFALMEGPIVLATLLRRAAFALASDAPVIPEASATLRPKGGIPVRVRRVPPPSMSDTPVVRDVSTELGKP
jgi:cytochrome P450